MGPSLSLLPLPSSPMSTFLSLITVVITYKKIQNRQKRSRSQHANNHQHQEYQEHEQNNNIHQDIQTDLSNHTISPRGIHITHSTPTPYYWNGFLECLQNLCDPYENPEGYIALCVSENKLVLGQGGHGGQSWQSEQSWQSGLGGRFMSPELSLGVFGGMDVFSRDGGGFGGVGGISGGSGGGLHQSLGMPSVRSGMAYFLARRFLGLNDSGMQYLSKWNANQRHPNDDYGVGMSTLQNGQKRKQHAHDHDSNSWSSLSSPSGTHWVNPDHVVIGAGCNSLLSHLVFCIADEGDAILIPSPHYHSFDNDLQVLPGCISFSFPVTDPQHGPTTIDLQRAFDSAEERGLNVRALLLTNPNDPLGVNYASNVILECVRWARSKHIHTIVDEVYALTDHMTPGNTPFQSVIKILNNQMNNDVHMLWSPSKMGLSGFRIGILYTQNQSLLQCISRINKFSTVSHPMQIIATQFLTDDAFLDSFLEDSRAQLQWSYTICTRKLEEMVIPFVPADSGLFVYADFSSLLPSDTFEGEETFWKLVHSAARVVMTPGGSQKETKPGYFRICYGWVSPEVLEIGMERISFLVAKIRRYHWDDLDASVLGDVTKVGTRSHLHRNPSMPLELLTRNVE